MHASRLSDAVQRLVHGRALREGRSTQSMYEILVKKGLEASGLPAAAVSPPLGDLSDAEMTELRIPLGGPLRAQLRAIAAEHGRSQRQMAARVIGHGLKALGCDHAVVDSALEAGASE
jgi:hypothetical protein